MSPSIDLSLLNRYEHKLVWNVNTLCNYRCAYCFFPPEVLAREHPAVGRWGVEEICRRFDATGRRWLVLLSGGEPFVYREFVALCRGLTRNHHIQVTTNLSRPGVYEFGRVVPPDRVMIVSASFHAEEREKRGPQSVDDFVAKYKFLRERGFVVLANYVTYPPMLDRMERDCDRLREAGVDQLTTLTFRGTFEGRSYPAAYTEAERRLITRLAIDPALEAEVAGGLAYQGVPCQAGQSYFQMDCDGTLHRCCTILEPRGNLFEGTARFDELPSPCTAAACQDACCGVSAVQLAARSRRPPERAGDATGAPRPAGPATA